jgi:hypothetical protein
LRNIARDTRRVIAFDGDADGDADLPDFADFRAS